MGCKTRDKVVYVLPEVMEEQEPPLPSPNKKHSVFGYSPGQATETATGAAQK